MRIALSLVIAAATIVLAAPLASDALPDGTKVQTYESGLNFPIDMAWVEGTKKIFFTQKSGKVLVMKGRKLLNRACVKLDVNDAGERGALGIVLHPDFKQNHKLYVYYTNASPLEHRVTRFKVSNNRCKHPRNVVTGLDTSSSGYHNGGQLEFVGGKLFVSVGEDHNAALAQDTSNRKGKVLRYNPDGSIPDGNPFSIVGDRNPVWSYGHRNPFGLTRKPGTSKLYETENGPDCDDELNRIVKGRNYGWGANYQCGSGNGTNPKEPLWSWTPPIVPTDPWWYKGKLKKLSGDLYMGDYDQGRLHRFVLNRRGSRVKDHRVIYNGSDGIVDVSKGPGGWLYFLTPDSIMRIVRS